MKLVPFGTSARQRNALMKMKSKIDLDFSTNLLAVSFKFNTVYASIGHI